MVAIVGEGEVAGIVGGYAFNAPCGANKQEVKTIVFSPVRMVRSFYVGPRFPLDQFPSHMRSQSHPRVPRARLLRSL